MLYDPKWDNGHATVRDTLIATRQRIASRARWAGSLDEVDQWKTCLLGALAEACDFQQARYDEALPFLQVATQSKLVFDFNDSHSHAEVLAAADRAIEAASR